MNSEIVDHELEELDNEIEIQSKIKDSILEKKLEEDKLRKEQQEKNKHIQILNLSNTNALKDNNNANTFENLSPEEKIKKLANLILTQKSFNIVDNAFQDFRILKKNFESKSNLEKIVKSTIIETIQVKFDPLEVSDATPLNIRIISDFYTVLDLLEEVCKLHGLNMKHYDLYDERDEKLLLTQTVKNYLNNKPADIITRFVFLKKDQKFLGFYSLIGDKSLQNSSAVRNDGIQEIQIMTKDLEEAEDNIITRLFDIIVFLFFLACVFTSSLSRFQIQQSFFVDDAIKTQIFEKHYFADNVYGLQNTFANVMNTEDVYDWLSNVYLNLFSFRDGNINNTNIINNLTVMFKSSLGLL